MTIEVSDHAPTPRAAEILTPEALAFVEQLHDRFAGRVPGLLTRRAERREELARNPKLDFLPETAEIRAGDWTVPEPPARSPIDASRSPARRARPRWRSTR